jgi:diguanylate cyclase
MFNFRTSKKIAAVAPAASASPSGAPASSPMATAMISAEDAERALETLAAVLRAQGAHAFDVEDEEADEIRQRFARWAEHVLVAAPLEGDKATKDEHGAVRRDWGSLRRLVTGHRKRESAFVTKTMTDLREVIWSFVASVTRAAAANHHEGGLARERLTHLRSALQGNDIVALRREATEAANAIEAVLDEQNQRQASQLAEFAQSVRKLGEELEGAKREGALDPLTRLHNRACFDEVLGRTVGLASLFHRSSCLLMVDIDHFKRVNDGFGHPGGDAVIKAVSDCLVRTFPRRDDLVARYGGDEFAVILKEVDPKDARALVQRLIDASRELRVSHQGRTIEVTLSVGLAACRDGDTAESWLARADEALYQAKSAGRNGWSERALPVASAA